MLQANFIIIYIIHKILVLLKITTILKHFSRSIIDFYFFKNNFFSQLITMKNSNLEDENITKDVRNPFKLKRNT